MYTLLCVLIYLMIVDRGEPVGKEGHKSKVLFCSDSVQILPLPRPWRRSPLRNLSVVVVTCYSTKPMFAICSIAYVREDFQE